MINLLKFTGLNIGVPVRLAALCGSPSVSAARAGSYTMQIHLMKCSAGQCMLDVEY